jgi:outer membrane lipoprotein-sorting protein
MFRKLRFALPVALLVAATSPILAQDTKAPTADEIIAKYLTARGGKDKITAVKTARMTGRMTVGPGVEAPFTLEMKRPDKMRMEFTFQGMTGIQAFDGTIGWMHMPFMGQTAPEKMPEEAIKDAKEMADMDGSLVDYEAKGNKIEYLGTEDVDGTLAYKLQVTKKDGDIETLFLDTESALPFKALLKSERNGQETVAELVFGDYKEVAGMMMPHSQEMRAQGAPAGQVITIDKIEIDTEVADDRFAMPAAAPAPGG